MAIPDRIEKGFYYEEAILMATFSQRVYDIFQRDDGTLDDEEIKQIYNATYRQEPWKAVHVFRNDHKNVRGLILKKVGENKYTVVFRGSVLTSLGTLEFTDFLHDFNSKLISYELVADNRCKVLEGNWIACNAVKDEISLFFKILASKKIDVEDFKKFESQPYDEKYALGSAIAAAGGLLYGLEFETKIRDLLSQALKDFDFNNLETKIQEAVDASDMKLIEGDDLRMEIYITGHSLGGAVSVMFAPVLKRLLNGIKDFNFNLKVYTIGACKTGNKYFVKFYNDFIGKDFHYSIENAVDPIVNIPPSPPFPVSIFAKDGVRLGNFYFSEVFSVGTSHRVIGLGSASVSLDFGGAIQIPGGIPFPHSFDTYVQLLQEQYAILQEIGRPIQSLLGGFIRDFFVEQEIEYKAYTYKQVQDLKQEIINLKNELKDLKS